MKNILITIVYFLAAIATFAQSNPLTEKYNCNDKANQTRLKISSLNDEWEKIKGDLKAGLFCSRCGKSKTELDKTEGFENHLGNVHGVAVPATQEEMDKAYKKYLDEFNSLNTNYSQQSKACEENYNAAMKSKADEEENARKEKADADKQAALEKQREIDEQKRIAEEQRKAFVKDQVDNINKNTEDLKNTINDNMNKLKDVINSINVPSEKISFQGKSENNIGTNAKLNDSKSNVDDFDMDANQKFDQLSKIESYEEWHQKSVEYLMSRNDYSQEQKQVFTSLDADIKNPQTTASFMGIIDKSGEYLSERIDDVKKWEKSVKDNFLSNYYVGQAGNEGIQSIENFQRMKEKTWDDAVSLGKDITTERVIDHLAENGILNTTVMGYTTNNALDHFNKAMDSFDKNEEYDVSPTSMVLNPVQGYKETYKTSTEMVNNVWDLTKRSVLNKINNIPLLRKKTEPARLVIYNGDDEWIGY